MKKVVKLTLAAAALATALVFASCSDGDDDDNTTTAQTTNGNGSGTAGTQDNGTVDTGNTGNSASSSSTSGTGNSGTENSGNSSGNSSSTGNSGTENNGTVDTGNSGSTVAEASGTVVEKSLTDLEGKIFKYTNEKGDRWYKFEGGKVYKSSDITNEYSWNDKTGEWTKEDNAVALLNGTQYAVYFCTLPRTSGSGLYATFSETFTEGGQSFTIAVTLKNDGTCTNTDPESGTYSAKFTNTNGLIAMTAEGDTMYGFYDGSKIYMVGDLLTEVTNN